jgi:ribosomal protein S18 acetylase RimI-like enzyme/GNAT superfamily N-acetyltransferase
MLARASLSVTPLDLADASVAAELHRVWQAAYAVEAQWLGERDFPPLRLDVNGLRALGHRFLGARLHGQLLGALAVEDTRSDAERAARADVQVAALVVDPVHHGEGIARELIAEFQRTVDADGAFAHTGVANAAARVAFGRMGFLWHRTFTLPSSAEAGGALPMVELRWRRRRIAADAPLSIRRLLAGEHALLRALRLRAMRQSPGEFDDDVGVLSVQPDAYWEAQARALVPPAERAMFVAERGARVCGCLVVRLGTGEPPAAAAEWLWVDPGQRHHGVDEALHAAAAGLAAAFGLGEGPGAPRAEDDPSR